MSLRETYQSRKNLLAANLTQQGVTASGSEGLTTLINKVLEISPAPPTPVLDHFDVELVDGKKILSYADEQQTPHSQYASLLFTAYDSNDDPIPGLEFDFSVTGESTVSAVCDNNGEYVYTYYSQGIGDVEITASKEVSGSVVSETYSIEDCTRYVTTEYSTIETPNWSLPNSDFKLEFELYPKSRSSCFPQIGIGTNTSNLIYIGQGNQDGRCSFIYKVNGTNTEVWNTKSITTQNSWNTIEYSFVNGEHTFKAVGETHTSSATGITLSKVVQIYNHTNNSSKIRNIKIKPL